MAKKFTIPFATQGDSATIPNELQVDGRVSYVQGFGHDYERDYDDPLAKDIGRNDMNGLFKDITEAVGEIQRLGAAEWSKDFVYPQGATVYHNGEMYVSDINENKNEPPNNWTSLKNISQGSLKSENNLSDVESAEISRQNLGLGSAATLNKTDALGTSPNLLATQQLVNNINNSLKNEIATKIKPNTANKSWENGWWKCGSTGLIFAFFVVTVDANARQQLFSLPISFNKNYTIYATPVMPDGSLTGSDNIYVNVGFSPRFSSRIVVNNYYRKELNVSILAIGE